MAPSNKSNKSNKFNSSASSSAQAAAQDDSRRTTRSMKAKQQSAATASAATATTSATTASAVTASAVTGGQNASNVAKQATSKSTKKTQSASKPATATTQETAPASSNTMASSTASTSASALGKRKSSSSEDSAPQQTHASKKAKTHDSEPVTSEKPADEPAPQQTNASKKAKTASSTTKIASASVLGKRKTSGSGDSDQQQPEASKKAKTQDTEPVASDKQAKGPVSTTSHLVIQHIPKTETQAAKTRVISNGHPLQSQVDIDDALEFDLTRIGKQPFHWGTQVEPATDTDMKDDFALMGFSSDEVDTMLNKRETLQVDGTAQRPFPGAGKSVPNTGPLKEKKKRASPKSKYQDLKVFVRQDWVVFDPLKGTPDDYGPPPEVMFKWAYLEPGNPRLLLHNKKKRTLLAVATPEALKEATVDYTELGPRIAGWKPIGTAFKPPKQPALAAAAPATATATAPQAEAEAAETETPALGRGARRKVAAAKKRESDEAAAVSVAKAAPSAPPPSPPQPAEAAENPPAAEESVLGEGKQKRKRRAGKPKKSEAKVEDSGSG